jgi:WD40 repeat protein
MVRWQTQDADAAQLRDQIRQAARTWDQHERSDDLLWTGSAYREFAVWRERYPGRLSETEEDFASAMTSHAKWRKRRRRIVAVAALMVAAVLAGVFGVLWRQSEREARRAEAANLLSLGQLELESYPSATIAYTIASLELADNVGARRLALEALWRGPTALVVNDESSWAAEFTPDGRSLVQGGDGTGHIRLIHSDGTSELLEHRHETDRINIRMGLDTYLLLGHEHAIWALDIDPLGRWIASGGDDSTVRLWPMPDLSKPPLHTLPHHELIAKLKTLTNLRVVRDEESSTGWKLEVGPFPGWETVPTW